LPIFVIYILICFLSLFLKFGEVKLGKGEKLYIVRDLIHADYVFDAKSIKELFYTDKKFVKVGWGDRKIFLETNKWSELKLIDFLTAFFGLNKTVLRVEYLDSLPKEFKEIDIDQRQLSVLKVHILNSYYGNQIEKKPNYYQKGEYYKSRLKYNCITNCNNWVNYGLYMARVTNRIWCPFSFWI
jgi:hypothetical protein